MAKLPERRQSDEPHMSTTNDKQSLVRASSTALARTGSQALARRGLCDLVATKKQIPIAERCCPEDEARLLFCLDHHCAHHRCPNVLHLDFALVPFTNHSPEGKRRLIEKGPIAPEYRDGARLLFCLDHQCTHNW